MQVSPIAATMRTMRLFQLAAVVLAAAVCLAPCAVQVSR